jgi:hypothetical protein
MWAPSLTRGRACSFQLRLILRPTVSRPVHLGIGHPFGGHDQILIFFCLRITFSFPDGRCPLSRKDGFVVCSAITEWSESRRTRNHISYVTISSETHPNLEIQVLVFISPQEQGGPVIPPGHWAPFLSLLTTRRSAVQAF